MTRFNSILAKGENRLGKLNEIMLRSRVRPYVYSSDISKMYNAISLEESAYPYSLFLYHPSLDKSTDPDVYVMTSAWYGVKSTGNQAGFVIEKLVTDFPEFGQDVKRALIDDRYVDDIIPGA